MALYVMFNVFSGDVPHAMTRKHMDMSQWRHTVAWLYITIDRREASALVDVRFSQRREDQDVLNVVFSFNI